MRSRVVGDDVPVASFLRKGLEAEHYAVDVAPDGEEARWLACECEYDLMVLDLTLPKLDGMGVLRGVRPKRPSLPVLVLTGRSRLEDRIHALDSGAGDCLVNPFSYSELAARVRALLRRRPVAATTVLRVADLELDRVERTVKRAGKRIELTSKEFGLLEYLLRNAGHRITRNMIVEHVWNLSFDTGTNVVDVYINYLRKKVDEGFNPKLIHTVRGGGGENAFVSEVLHALSQPLTALECGLELSLRQDKTVAELRNRMETLLEAAQLLRRRVLELRALQDAADAGNTSAPVAVNVLLENLQDDLSPVTELSKIGLVVKCRPARAYGNAERLRNGFFHLLEFLLRRCPGGSVTLAGRRSSAATMEFAFRASSGHGGGPAESGGAPRG